MRKDVKKKTTPVRCVAGGKSAGGVPLSYTSEIETRTLGEMRGEEISTVLCTLLQSPKIPCAFKFFFLAYPHVRDLVDDRVGISYGFACGTSRGSVRPQASVLKI